MAELLFSVFHQSLGDWLVRFFFFYACFLSLEKMLPAFLTGNWDNSDMCRGKLKEINHILTTTGSGCENFHQFLAIL